ncbi:MAG: M23 family metallopeptidase [Calditrichaeota bacterium]|nr:M23 family metallopeptidase [Calditrichota bacterium]MCB9391613.1 M23 family metallopeptidase [Calditrichota bacterium]
MRQFRIRKVWLITALAVAGLCVVLLFGLGASTWILASKVQDNTALQNRVLELEQTNDKIRDIAANLAELRQFEQKLRRGLLLPEGTLPSADALSPDDASDESLAERLPEDDSVLGVYAENPAEAPVEGVLPSDIPTYPPVRGYVTRHFEHKTALDQVAHYGLDVAAREGTQVLASAQGLVVFAGWSYPYGNLVVLLHKSGYQSFYGHNQTLLVQSGDRILQGQPIALVGNSGRSTAPHLHFEIWKDGVRVNPESVLARDAG